MTLVIEKCSMFGCEELSYRALTVAPGTVLKLCLKHFIEEGGVVEEEVDQAGVEIRHDHRCTLPSAHPDVR